MQFLAKRWVQTVLLVVFVTLGYLWLSGEFRATPQAGSIKHISLSVLPPSADQKKVVLKNLGMTRVFCRASVELIPGIEPLGREILDEIIKWLPFTRGKMGAM